MELARILPDKGASELTPKHPIIFILGCARSGTTLLSQYLSQFDQLCYPTNFISRFYYSPYVGSLLQKLMFDLDSKGELFGRMKREANFTSDLGKTSGPLAPSEFWYYWRRFFKFGEIQKVSYGELDEVDKESFINGLLSIQSVFNKPMFLKGMIMNWNIPFISKSFINSYFIFVTRDVVYNAQSLLLARERFFGDPASWYSFKPEEYHVLKGMDPLEQVVGQVHFTNKAINEGLLDISSERVIRLTYEDFCANPLMICESMKSKWSLHLAQQFQSSFKSSNVRVLDVARWNRLNEYAAKYR